MSDNLQEFINANGYGGEYTSFNVELINQKAKEHAKNIFENWKLLNHIILRHESAIQKRWLKKTRDARRNTLLHAWPKIPKKHRPDMEAVFETPADRLFNPAYLWPDINLEDLLLPKILLIFLNSRARNYPSVFAGVDERSFKLGCVTEKLKPTDLANHTMMFTGHNSPLTYGQLYNWRDNEESFIWLMTGKGTRPGMGLLVLKAQEHVYRFLVDCCLHILQVTREAALADATPIEPEPPAISMIEGPVYSLSDIASAVPYSVPAKLDLVYLRELIAARRAAAEDHFFSLREDPGYFENAILEMKDHRLENLPDLYGRPHSLMKPFISKELWKYVVSDVIIQANGILEVWRHMLSQIDELISLLEKYDGQLKEESHLPDDLLNSFLDLEYSIEGYMNFPLTTLKHVVNGSRPLRNWFFRMPEESPQVFELMSKPPANKDPTQERIIVLFQVMFNDGSRKQIGTPLLLDMMERLVENDTKSRKLLTSRVADSVADYSLLAECQRQIMLFQPWASTFEQARLQHEMALVSKYNERTKRMSEVEAAFKLIDLGAADPSDKKFYYPVDKPRTKEITEAIQLAENNLDRFWGSIDQTVLKKVTGAKGAAWSWLSSVDRTLQRTPDWIDPAPKEMPKETPKDKKKKKKKAVPVEELMQGLELRTESTIDNQETKQQQKDKVKTRGTAAPATEKTESKESVKEADVSSQSDPQPTFKLDKKALKVFSTLFYQPSVSSQPGEIPWTDFLHAMRETGFTAAKMYGSVWHFTPADSGLGRSIQFHEPHPSSKIPFNIARCFGRRLFRNYGWRGDMFVPEDPKV